VSEHLFHRRRAVSRAKEIGLLLDKLRHQWQRGDDHVVEGIAIRSSFSMSNSPTRRVMCGNMEASHQRQHGGKSLISCDTSGEHEGESPPSCVTCSEHAAVSTCRDVTLVLKA
jgi:hypothetical protein